MSGIHFVELNGEKLLGDARRTLEELIGEPLQPGDARYLLLMHVMQLIVGGFALIDQTGRSNLLRYAQGEVLDALGERVDTPRLQKKPAAMTVRYTLETAREISTVIPTGYRTTPDGVGVFATVKALTIPAGAMHGDVRASLLGENGADSVAYNGIPAGTAMAMMDRVMGVANVVTLEDAAGGQDQEQDDLYRERIRLAPSRFTTTGTADAYLYHARSATTLVADAGVRQAAPGEVEIAILVTKDAPDPGAAVRTVFDYVSDAKRRTLTDRVTVREAEEAPYGITLTYYANPIRLAEVVQAIEGPNGALEQYIEWQDGVIGRDINPDKLRALMLNAGAERIDLTEPSYTDVGELRRAKNTGMTIGREPLPESEAR